MQRTYSTELSSLPPSMDAMLESSCALFGQVCRHYHHQHYVLGKEKKDIKRECIRLFKMNSRWFNAVRFSVDGQMASAKESRKLAMDNLTTAIAKQKARIKDLTKQKSQALSVAGRRFGKVSKGSKSQSHARTPGQWRETLQATQGKLLRQEHELDSLKEDVAQGRAPQVCFGSRKLFASQYRLAANGFTSHREWKTAWHEARNNQVFLVGSKGETAGNQNFQAVPVKSSQQSSSFELFITLPEAAVGAAPRRVSLGVVQFSTEGAKSLHQALDNNIALSWRLVRTRQTTRSGRAIARTTPEARLSTAHTWRVHFSTELPASVSTSLSHAGAIGVDFNANHIAGCRIDASGNVVEAKRFPLITTGKSKEQITQAAAVAVKEIVAWAVSEKLPVIGEALDFAKKKKTLGQDNSPQGRRYARMLSGLAYSKFFQLLQSRCFDAGISFHQVNPAYTSIIGQANYATRLGISSHQAAACVIARRYFTFSERPMCPQDINAPDSDQRDRHRHVWTYWHKVAASSSRRKSWSHPPSVSKTIDLPPCTAYTGSGCVSQRTGRSNAGHPVIPLSTGHPAA